MAEMMAEKMAALRVEMKVARKVVLKADQWVALRVEMKVERMVVWKVG